MNKLSPVLASPVSRSAAGFGAKATTGAAVNPSLFPFLQPFASEGVAPSFIVNPIIPFAGDGVDPSWIIFAQPFANEGVDPSWIIFAQPFDSEGV
jgi:hypothetical protein